MKMINLQKITKFIKRFGIRRYKDWIKRHPSCVSCPVKECDWSKKKNNNCFESWPLKDPSLIKLKLPEKMERIIIIGGGMAGLSAAEHLIKHGYTNVVILEAAERVGGRIFSTWMADTAIDLGVMTINGASVNNPIYNLANSEKLMDGQKTSSNTNFSYITSYSRIIEDTFVETMFNELLSHARRSANYDSLQQSSILDYFSLRIQQIVMHLPIDMRYDLERLLYGMLYNLKTVYGGDLNEIGVNHLRANRQLIGNDIKIPRGFSTLLASVVRNLPNNCTKLNKVVNKIEWSIDDNPKVIVKCDDGEEFRGRFAIITIPLGALLQNYNTMFVPKLPKHKRKAMKQLGVGHIAKGFLEYSTPWWVNKELNLRFAILPNEIDNLHSWTKSISSIQELGNLGRVLLFTVGGEDALLMESDSEIQITIEFTNFIRKKLNDSAIPFPNNIVITRWSHSPHSLGSTVYLPIKANLSSIKDFFLPKIDYVDDNERMPILFAGDATSRTYLGTLHGARLSGIREAERILKRFRNKDEQNNTEVSSEETKQAVSHN